MQLLLVIIVPEDLGENAEALVLHCSQHIIYEPACRWDCHGLPVEFEIDKKLGESLQALLHSDSPLHNFAMHVLGSIVCCVECVDKRWQCIIQAFRQKMMSSRWALTSIMRNAEALS